MSKTDDRTLKLIQEVTKRKAEISKAEKPNWKTNCSFPMDEQAMSKPVNIHVEKNVRSLVTMAAMLRSREKEYKEAAEVLGVDAPTFTWGGYVVADWMGDIKARIDKIQIEQKKSQLAELESRLNSIISPELRAELELQAIEAALG